MFELGRGFAFEFGDDGLGQGFAKFDTPLVEGINVPDRSLGEDIVFVERDELAEYLGSEFVGEDGICRTVALEDAVRDEPGGCALGLDLRGGFPKARASVWARTLAIRMSW